MSSLIIVGEHFPSRIELYRARESGIVFLHRDFFLVRCDHCGAKFTSKKELDSVCEECAKELASEFFENFDATKLQQQEKQHERGSAEPKEEPEHLASTERSRDPRKRETLLTGDLDIDDEDNLPTQQSPSKKQRENDSTASL